MYFLFDMFINRSCSIKIKIAYKLYTFIKIATSLLSYLSFQSRISEDHARQLEGGLDEAEDYRYTMLM